MTSHRVPAPDRDDAQIMEAHDAAVRAHEPLYRDPLTGLWTFTSVSLAERGWCCEQGCRHCPFPQSRKTLPGT